MQTVTFTRPQIEALYREVDQHPENFPPGLRVELRALLLGALKLGHASGVCKCKAGGHE